MLYLVDGYNMIGAWPEFKSCADFSQCRELLTAMLADFAGFTGDEVMLVFDGYKGDKMKTTIERVSGIDVVFTKRSETADHFIERTVDERMENLPRFSQAAIRTSSLPAARCAFRPRKCAPLCAARRACRRGTIARRAEPVQKPSKTACLRMSGADWKKCAEKSHKGARGNPSGAARQLPPSHRNVPSGHSGVAHGLLG